MGFSDILAKMKKTASKVALLLMDIVKATPWGVKLSKAKTIVAFIDDLAEGRSITATKVIDVACAINAFLPSLQSLGKYFSSDAATRAAMLKEAALQQVSMGTMKRWARRQATKCFKQFKKTKTICHMQDK